MHSGGQMGCHALQDAAARQYGCRILRLDTVDRCTLARYQTDQTIGGEMVQGGAQGRTGDVQFSAETALDQLRAGRVNSL